MSKVAIASQSTVVREAFDYSVLDDGVAKVARDAARRIHHRNRASIIDTGRDKKKTRRAREVREKAERIENFARAEAEMESKRAAGAEAACLIRDYLGEHFKELAAILKRTDAWRLMDALQAEPPTK